MNDHYYLAIDVGTSRVAAATARLAPDGGIAVVPFPLGRRSDNVATVVFVAEDGELLFGDAAERRGVTQPDRLIREFKRSIGDQVPLMVAGRAMPAEYLYARTVASIVDTVAEREGAYPVSVMLTHPATWGQHRLGMIRSALGGVDVFDVGFISEPEAAARSYESSRPLDAGQTLAVYDLGGGTFDSVILRKNAADQFEVVGQPAGIDNLGGADFDDAVLRHVLRSAQIDQATLSDPESLMALAQLRRECVEAKEALSFDSDAAIPVVLPSISSRIRLTRAEFDSMIDPSLELTINSLDDALADAGIEPEDVECILLIGGSSRIPLVTQRLSERFDRPTAIDVDPKSSIALGAALTALVRDNDDNMGVSGELALLASADAAAAAEVALFQAAGPVALAAPKAAAVAKPNKRHTLALTGGAILIAGAIVFGSTVAAGTNVNDAAWSETEASSTPTAVPTDPAVATPTDPAAEQAPVTEAQADAQTSSPGASKRAPKKTTTTETSTTTDSSAAARPTARPTPTNPPAPAPATGGSGTTGNTGPSSEPSAPPTTPSSPSTPSQNPIPEPVQTDEPVPTTPDPVVTTPPTEEPPAEEPPAEEPPADTTPVEQPPAEQTPPADTPPADTPAPSPSPTEPV